MLASIRRLLTYKSELLFISVEKLYAFAISNVVTLSNGMILTVDSKFQLVIMKLIASDTQFLAMES